MSSDRYSGDPRITLTQAGADMTFLGGQPVMDQGLENFVMISLFTSPGWCGNFYLAPEEQVGSDFELACRKPITLQSLIDVQNAAMRALKSDYFPSLSVTVSNPRADWLHLDISLGPGSSVSLDRRGLNWIAQATNPAHARTGGL